MTLPLDRYTSTGPGDMLTEPNNSGFFPMAIRGCPQQFCVIKKFCKFDLLQKGGQYSRSAAYPKSLNSGQ